MNEGPSKPDNRKAKATGYFIAAGGALTALAFTWSIDASFVYLFLGAAVFLIFLGFWTWPRRPRTSRFNQPYTQSTERERPREQADDRTTRPSSAAPETQKTAKVVVTIVVVFSFAIFLFIFLGAFLRTNNESQPSDYFVAAEQYYATEQYDSAYVNYKLALSENPDHADALLGLGNTFSQQDNPDSALVFYDRALAVNPDMDAARYNKGWVEYNRKRYSEAERELTALIEKNPSYLDAMQLLGNVFYDQNRYDEALRWYEQAYTAGLRGNWICHVMGFLYQNKGDNTRAIALYKEALTYDSTVLDIYKRLGEIVPGDEGESYRRRGAGQQW
jgi:Tfp pilus assembly protein PilF